VAIGFNEVGDPRELERDALFERAREAAGGRGGGIAGQVDRFARVMDVGDLVIVPDGETRRLGRISRQVPMTFGN
jgi:predicted Mrr-cat superfamily restriction endonuclease